MSENQKFDPMAFTFKASLLVIIFLAGGFFALKGIPPFGILKQGFQDSYSLYKEMTLDKSPLLLAHAYEGDGVTIYDREQTSAGLTIMQGIFADGLQVRMIDMDGSLVNSWPLNFFDIWPDPAHLTEQKRPKSPYDHHSQGVLALPDGSIIANFGYLGTAKLDKCGKVLWTIDRMTRHFVAPMSDGNYWIGANRENR